MHVSCLYVLPAEHVIVAVTRVLVEQFYRPFLRQADTHLSLVAVWLGCKDTEELHRINVLEGHFIKHLKVSQRQTEINSLVSRRTFINADRVENVDADVAIHRLDSTRTPLCLLHYAVKSRVPLSGQKNICYNICNITVVFNIC